jgi:heat-inducible transcriptional repressor
MRTVSSGEIEDRKQRILQAVIHLYIKTGKPVGSSAIGEAFPLSLSPASIRHVLGELEREGLLTHPHTSAGRIPTDKGYRVYVDSLAEIQRLALGEETRLREEYEIRMREIEQVMLSTSRILSTLSRCTGFILAPRLEDSLLRHLELVLLDPNRLLAILVSESGHVRHEVFISNNNSYDHELVRQLNSLLNERLRGLSFPDIRSQISLFLSDLEQHHMNTWQMVKEISNRLFTAGEETELYVDGANNILSFPEFQDSRHLNQLVHFMDTRKTLAEILTRELQGPNAGPRVKIGRENQTPELEEFSVVSSTYAQSGRPVGVLGILGPKRMEYDKMIAIVNAVSGLLNQALDRMGPVE